MSDRNLASILSPTTTTPRKTEAARPPLHRTAPAWLLAAVAAMAFRWRDDLNLLLTPPIPPVADRDPVADRLRGLFKLSGKLIRIAAGAEQFDHLSTKFR
jgi:hypothetical protein